jgi:hypothetical protein
MTKVRDFDFEVGLLDHGYRAKDWQRDIDPPKPGLKESGTYVSAYLTGDSGKRYHGQREFDGTTVGQSHTLSFCQLRDGERHGWPDELWPSPQANQLHPYDYSEEHGRVTYSTEHALVTITDSGWTWDDGSGSWHLELTPLGDFGYYFWIPVQDDIPICDFHVGGCYRATGNVNGDAVRGYCYLERAWGPADSEAQFWDLPLIRRMNKLWMHWYADFEDGGYTTGCARKGRLGVNWSMAYVVNDGKASVSTPTMTDIAYTRDGLVKHARLNTGEQVFEFDQDCASYYPIHTMGRVESVTDRPAVKDSWTNLEWWPDNADVVLKYAVDHHDSAKGILGQLAEFPIVGERMILPIDSEKR